MKDLRMGRMAGSGARLLSAAALALALGAIEARADHIFTLSSVTFDDGGTATGTFTTNDALNSLVNYDITTSGGTLTGFDYTPGTTTSFSSLPSILVVETASLDHLIQLTFTGLTVAGAPITIGQFDSFEQDPTGAHRQVVAGSVVGTAVPEPSSFALAGTAALAALGLLSRRRSAASRVG
jgi:MYXO-CTERM domain-containing protein